MKNNRIVRAYDSINPSSYDKAKMLDAILAEANLEEEPMKPKSKKKEPVIYSARPTRSSKRSILGGLAACLAVCFIGGTVLLNLGKEPVNPAYVEPTVEQIITGTQYDAVLAKYRAALKEGWTKDQCEIEGITPRMQSGGDFTKVGYALLDLDGDGREELLIAEESVPHIDVVWDIYTTLEDGTPIQLWVDELTGGQCRLHEGNVLSISDSYQDELEQIFYDLQDEKLVMREMLQWEDEDTVFHTDAEGNTRQVTSREGQDISNAYDIQKLELTWLADIADDLRDTEAMEQYTPVLEKYRTALAEGWNRTMCVENGMSMLTPIESDNEDLYYTIFDLDGNGTEELIIREHSYTDSLTDFIDIYTIVDGQVTNIMSRGDMDLRYLCQGGYVKDCTPPEQGGYDAYVSFWHLEGNHFVQTGHVYSMDGQWYHGLRADERITAEEANAELESYKTLNLNYFRISDSSVVEYLTGYAAFDDIVDKYVTAINWRWTEQQCEQNDISPNISLNTVDPYDLGWCLLDIDQNGVEELIIGDSVYIYDIYVMQPHNGGPGHLIMKTGTDHYIICQDGTIEKQVYFSKGMSWYHYELSDIDLQLKNVLTYRNEYEGTKATEMYYYGSNEDNGQPISKEEAGKIISSHQEMMLTFTPFIVRKQIDVEAPEAYKPLLDTYRKAIREDWGPGTCVENGISLMVGHYGDFVEALGYAIRDLNSDGIDELIITDGLNVYDLYTIVQDETDGPLRLVNAMERIEYFLTTDGWIYCMGSGSASVSYHTLYSLGDRGLDLIEGFMFNAESNPESPWYYYDGVEQGAPCPSAIAGAAMDSYIFAEIPFTSFE